MRAGFLSTGGKQTKVHSRPNPGVPFVSGVAAAAARCLIKSNNPLVSLLAGPHFGRLSQETLNLILSQLEPADLSNLAATSRGIAAGIEDGELWRQLTRRHFPCSRCLLYRGPPCRMHERLYC